ncbi:MAG: metal ABC transporter substrate-binding protein, partial [Anaerotignum sp.]|nr:metal ABC transporter substrate-binding protein [Anaerotignum sp.]
MKKLFAILLTGVLTLGLAACGGSEPAAEDGSITLKIGATPTPHAEILNAAADELAALGVTLEIVEFTDYVQPNLATESGDLDANFFQHTPYLDTFNADHGTELVSAGTVHYEPMGIFAGTAETLADIPEGGKIGIP